MSGQAPKLLYKFGKTSFVDVLERFKVETHEAFGWRGVPFALDYRVTVLWSHWVTVSESLKAEAWFKETYPKTFFCDTEYNGITECRDWEPKRSYAFTTELRSKYPADKGYQLLTESLFKRGNITSTHRKIYFVMLNKK